MMNQDNTLKVRSSLGKWYRESDRTWYKFFINETASFGESRQYRVLQLVAPYKPLRRYNLTETEIKVIMDVARVEGYVQTEFTYPELQDFFRNGEPVTWATLIGDAFENIKAPELSPMEEMFNSMI